MSNLFIEKTPSIDNNFGKDSRIVLSEGDCLDEISIIPADTVKLIITSPPYNVGKEYERVTGLDNYLHALEPVLKELVRILSPQGSICWQVGNYVDKSEVFPLDIFYYPLFKS
ncbi:MAG: hypothetical protein KAT56_11875, partial [Sedimentisphaerales bacterium]|nr:hypothetical protein [Sedimentisphaerales bacterium]